MTRTGAVLGAICGAIAAALFLFDPAFFGAEWLILDPFTRVISSRNKADPRVMVVAISRATDEALAEAYGRPPYPRDVHASVVRELMRAGASVIAFDFTFPDEDIPHPDADRVFATAIEGAPVVLGVDTHVPRAKEEATDLSAFADRLWRIQGEYPQVFNVRLPYFKTAPAIGTIRLASLAHTSVTHEYPIADHVGSGKYVPSLAIEAARMFLRGRREGSWKRGAFAFAGREVPVDANRTLVIRWSDFLTQDNVVDFHKVLAAALLREQGEANDEVPKLEARFRDKIVLIAYTTQGMHEQRSTPLSAESSGVEIHANAIANLINGTFNRPANRALMAILIVALAALLGGAIHRIRKQVATGALAISVVGLWFIAGLAALSAGIIIPIVAGSSSVALTFIVITVIKFMAEQRQTVMLRTTFGRYVSPQILEHVLAHPEKVQLGGERRDLTILFSDIRGFTTISEASEPEQVVEMLNEYLTRMVEILLDHGGTLDKFIGDAVMGFWNAPAVDPDHPRHAVACALEMIEETAKIRARWETEGKASIRIGIGVNSGDAVVGNIGAEKVFGYTVIGDAVNLASRLEGKNKDYGTEIIISEFTKARIGDEFELVYLDEVKVKGKELAVRIYEVKGRVHA